ncbi:MAG: YidH family protein [Planktothrix sp.]
MTQEQKTDRQRGHQANERTFLAWLRTSISLIALGFAIAQFTLFLHQLKSSFSEKKVYNNHIFNSDNIGIILVITGMIIIVIAAWNYNQVFWQIEQGNYKPNRLLIWMMTGIVIILGLMSLPLFFRRDLPQKNVPNALDLQSNRSLPFVANILIGLRY